MNVADAISLGVACLSLLATIFTLVRDSNRASRTDLKELEHRLSVLETNQTNHQKTVDGLGNIGERLNQVALLRQEIENFKSNNSFHNYERLLERVKALETKVDVFWKAVSIDAAMLLHSPHPDLARRDMLLEKFTFDSLSPEEVQELHNMLNELLEDRSAGKDLRMAASIVLRRLSVEYKLEDIPTPDTGVLNGEKSAPH